MEISERWVLLEAPYKKDHEDDAGDPPQDETALGFGFGVIIFETLPLHLLEIMQDSMIRVWGLDRVIKDTTGTPFGV